MPCYTPLSAYRGRSVNPKTGKRPVVFHLKDGYHDLKLQLPCGRCIGCRLERSRQWAIRCMHEASLHKHNVFITLTYSDQALLDAGNAELKQLQHDDFQKFMKRLRKRLDFPIRYYMCGEYGDKFGRPHFHAALFGVDFPDKKYFKKTKGGPIFTSKILEETWGLGFVSIGKVTFNSAAYIARYVLKKKMGRDAPAHYERLDEYGEYHQISPEYQQASRRPGLARGWFEKYKNDVYPKDSFHINGQRMRPPKYYDLQFEIASPEEMKEIKKQRRIAGYKHALDNTRERLDDRWIIQELKQKQIKRNLDNES